MKLRVIFGIAVALVLAAIALRWWPVQKDFAYHPSDKTSPPSSPSRIPGEIDASHPTPAAATPARVARISTSVMPGQPMHRSSPAPAKANFAPRRSVMVPAASEEDPEEKRLLEDVRFMFNNYHARLGENPVGTNAEIMKAIMGDNRDGMTLGPPAGQSLNERGELVDFWGTPYFFHQLDAKTMEVRSAGPDRVMWTADDLTTR